jgi:hypothetical protein
MSPDWYAARSAADHIAVGRFYRSGVDSLLEMNQLAE